MRRCLVSRGHLAMAFAIMAVVETPALAQTRSFDIAAQPLASALREFGLQSGQTIVFDARATKATRSPGVKGTWEEAKALTQILQGSGLVAIPVGQGYVIKAKARQEKQKKSPASHLMQAPASSVPHAPPVTASENIDDIVVTARRRDELLSTTPVAVTALTAEDLDRKSINSVADLTRTTPNLSMASTGSRSQVTVSLRGQRRSPLGAGAPTVVIYMAEVPLPNTASLIPTFDLASIQVLKGPQGTLFGRNTTAGAILVTPAAPTYDLGGYFTARLGSHDRSDLEAALNIPIVEDVASLRMAGVIARREGYTKNEVGGPDMDDEHNESFRATLKLEPTATLTNTTMFDYFHANEVGNSSIPYGLYPNATAGGGSARLPALARFFNCGTSVDCDVDLQKERQDAAGIRRTFATAPAYQHTRLIGITNTSTLDIGAVRIKNIFGYRSVRLDYGNDNDGSGLPLIATESVSKIGQYTNELQFSGNVFGGNLDWIAGLFYAREKPEGANISTTSILAPPGSPPAPPVVFYRTSTSKAIFGQVSYNLDDILRGVTIDLGGRYTWDKGRDCFTSTTSSGLIPDEANCKATNETLKSSSSAANWVVGINYQASDALFLYLTSRRGYRGGGVNRPILGGILTPFQQVKPETVTDFELGAKINTQVMDMPFRFNIAAYTGRYSGIQRNYTTTPDFDGDGNPANDPLGGLMLNSGVARIKGVEFDVTIKPTPELTLAANGGYNDIHYTRLSVPDIFETVGLITPDAIDNTFPYAPKYTFSASAEYLKPLGDEIGDLLISVDYYWTDFFTIQERPAADPATRAPGYDLVNLRAGIQNIGGAGLDAMFVARNLFNQKYIVANGAAAPALTMTSVVYGPPRMLGVELRARF